MEVPDLAQQMVVAQRLAVVGGEDGRVVSFPGLVEQCEYFTVLVVHRRHHAIAGWAQLADGCRVHNGRHALGALGPQGTVEVTSLRS